MNFIHVTPSLRVLSLFHPLPSLLCDAAPHPLTFTDYDSIRIHIPHLRVPFVIAYVSLSAWVYR